MKTAYFLSGLGADERLFKYQLQENIPIKIISWLVPEKNESLDSYARRMSNRISTPDDSVILGGVSFDGIVALKMSQYIQTEKVILISSIKYNSEIPFYIRIWKYLPIYKLMGGELLKKTGVFFRLFFGSMPDNEKNTFLAMVKDTHPYFIEWAADKICNLKTRISTNNVVHIHGTSDLIFPVFKIKKPVIKIKGGTHLMIMTSSKEVNQHLKSLLE